MQEAALVPLAVGDIQRIDQRLDAGISAPDGEGEAEQKRRAKFGVAFGEHPRDLVLHDLECSFRQHQRQLLQIGADRRGVGEQSVGRDQRGHGWKQCEESEEHHAGRDRK